jgi:uncharacterized RDD family membrane protein YckC
MAFIPPNGYAPFWKRAAAAVVDGILWTVAYYVVGVIVVALAVLLGGWGYSAVTINAIGIFMGWLYSALLESSPWQATLGKMVVDLQVCDLAGNPLSFRHATGRYFGKFLSTVPLGAGFLLPLFRQDRQALHDRLAGTLVIHRL